MTGTIFRSLTGVPAPVIQIVLGLILALVSVARIHGETVEGFAEPFRTIQIAAAAEPGLIAEILVREGDPVRAGDVVARLDCGVLEASLEIAQKRSQFLGRLRAAEAERAMHQKRLESLQLLQQRGHTSPAELDRAETDLAVARAQVILAQEELELAELECRRIRAQIAQRVFVSPIDGVVSDVARQVGEAVLLNDPQLMTLVQLHPLRVRFPVSVGTALGLKQGQELPVFVSDRNQTVTATVELIAPVLDAKSGTVEVSCILNNEQSELRSGMRCLLRIGANSESDMEPTDPAAKPASKDDLAGL